MLACDLKLGYSCNNNCIHCVIADEIAELRKRNTSYDLTTKECIAILDVYKQAGVSHIVLTGGEPTIRSDFLELVRYCSNLGFSIGVQSNGRKFADASFSNGLSSIEKISFTIAIHGPNSAIHDRITNRPGSFKETLNGLQNLRSIGKKIEAKIVISKYNMKHLVETLKLLNSLEIKEANFTYPHALGNARKNFHEIMPTYTDLKRWLTQLVEKAQIEGMDVDFEAIPFCIIPDYPQYVSEIYYLLNIKKLFQPVRKTIRNWNEIRPTIKMKGRNCSRCCYSRICEGPWKEYIEHFGDEELQPVEFNPSSVQELFSKILKISD